MGGLISNAAGALCKGAGVWRRCALGSRADLWIAPQVGHTGAFARYPDEYERRITGFFDSALAQ